MRWVRLFDGVELPRNKYLIYVRAFTGVAQLASVLLDTCSLEEPRSLLCSDAHFTQDILPFILAASRRL